VAVGTVIVNTSSQTGEPGPDLPLVTFGIPAYRRPDLLKETLASLAAQTGAHKFEVVVCDDGGLEETRQLAAAFPGGRASYHRNQPSLGPVANWNECFKRARGEWVTILHEDDALYPWYLDVTTPLLQSTAVAVCTQTVQGATMHPRSRPSGTAKVHAYPSRFFLKSSMTPFPGVLVRKTAVSDLNGFDRHWGPLADYDFWYRLSRLGTIEQVKVVAAFYRVSEGQWTESAWPRMITLTHLMRLRIAREQFPDSPRAGRWLARFFTVRNARSYARRFPQRPASLSRALRLGRIPLSGLPSGWVWQMLKRFS
jgi:GT2 family glycosyltransferase